MHGPSGRKQLSTQAWSKGMMAKTTALERKRYV